MVTYKKVYIDNMWGRKIKTQLYARWAMLILDEECVRIFFVFLLMILVNLVSHGHVLDDYYKIIIMVLERGIR